MKAEAEIYLNIDEIEERKAELPNLVAEALNKKELHPVNMQYIGMLSNQDNP